MKWRKEKDTKQWIIVKVAKQEGIAVSYFALDGKQAWRWTRHPEKACVFRSPENAYRIIRETSAYWQALWEIRCKSI